jgi:hypothetical protein
MQHGYLAYPNQPGAYQVRVSFSTDFYFISTLFALGVET